MAAFHFAHLAGFDRPLTVKPFGFVLTNNPVGGETGLNTGCSYTADPPCANPADPESKRLLDRDKPSADWNTTTGFNWADQDVIFDLKFRCRIDAVAMLFDAPQKPAHVEVFVSETAEGPWKSAGTMLKQDQKEIWWRLELKDVAGRYVKLFHKLDTWGWYLREVKIYGDVLAKRVAGARRAGADLILADHGTAHASIVVADQPHPHSLQAAAALRENLFKIADVWLPIKRESAFHWESAAVLVGASKLASELGSTVAQNPLAGEQYIIRTGERHLAVVGNDTDPGDQPNVADKTDEETRHLRSLGRNADVYRCSIYGVYDLLERLGCGWYGPDPLWRVIPKRAVLSVGPLDVKERPAFQHRSMWMHGMDSQELRDAWRLGGRHLETRHILHHVLPPEKHKQDHPDWFGPEQPCLTHPEVIRHFAETYRKVIELSPQPAVVALSLSANDTGGYCQCERCKAAGNISARMLRFANAVARELHTTHPNRFLLTFYAYWHAHAPPDPMVKAEPGVCVMMVNEGNHVKPWDSPEPEEVARNTSRNNTREVDAFRGWRGTGGLQAIYEWWIPAVGSEVWKDVPWYSGETALRNLRYWNRGGIRYVSYESQGEHNGGFPLRWPLYYVGARGLWNPDLTTGQIMTEACGKLYGPAAESMRRFYEALELAMANSNEHAGNWHLPSPEKIYTPAVEIAASRHLEEAAKATTDKTILARIAVEREMWTRAKLLMARLRAVEKTEYAVVLDGKTMAWKEPTITRAVIISLYGLSEDVKLDVVEKDGQNRRLLDKDKIDLTTGVVFKTAPTP